MGGERKRHDRGQWLPPSARRLATTRDSAMPVTIGSGIAVDFAHDAACNAGDIGDGIAVQDLRLNGATIGTLNVSESEA